jgi:hypothetical protein
MPLEKRDPVSKARLFVPTQQERSLVNSQKALTKSMQEVEAMKRELKEMIEKIKGT